ncbi:PAS domain S-box protein [Capilliphycus salinus ALCB114379]|uniref:PAS domain S-box protein n=1 Tax=Capilliphycus salinus TaxID=2768948 RepID=UPI0039A72411
MGLTRTFLPYGIAFSFITIAFLLTAWLEPLIFPIITPLFYIAIILSSWSGGFRAGMVAIVLSTLGISYFFIPPRNQFWVNQPENLLELGLFLIVGIMINLAISNLRESKKKLERLKEQLTQENSQQLRMALSAAQMGMWDWNLVTGEIEWSPEHEQLFGLTPGSFDGKYETFDGCIHPEDRPGINQAVERSLNNKIPYYHEYRIIWPDGNIHWIEGRGQTVYDAEDQPVRMIGTIMAIDQRKQAETLLHQQFEQQRLVQEITHRIRQSLNLSEILQTTVEEIRQLLQTDRVIIFKFTPYWRGTVLVESVGPEWTAILSTEIYDPCFAEEYIQPFKQGLVTAKSDIYEPRIQECHLQLLESFQVRANLVVPIINGEELWGLLIAHHCAEPRPWTDSEISLMRQLALQLGIAIQQANLFEQIQTELNERRRVEAALRESQNQLQRQLTEIESIYRSAPIGLNILDTELRFVRINQHLAEMNGIPVEDHIGRTVGELLPELAERAEPLLKSIIETGEPLFNVEINGETPAQPGVKRTWLESFLPLKDGDRVIGISTVCEEITDRKKAEIALRKSEERYRMLFESIDEGFCVIEMLFDDHNKPVDFRFLEVNPTFERQTGLQQALGKTIREFIPNLEPEWFDIYAEVALTGEAIRFEGYSAVRNGWFDVYAFPVPEKSNRKVAIVFQNITERKQAEIQLKQLNTELEERVKERTAELEETNERLRDELDYRLKLQQELLKREQLLDAFFNAASSANIGLSIRDQNLRYLKVNQALAEINGVPIEDHIGKTVEEILSSDMTTIVTPLLQRVIDTGEAIRRLDVSGINPDRPELLNYFLVSYFPIFSETQQAIAVGAIVLDITQRKRIEEALRQREAQFQSLVANVPGGIYTLVYSPDGVAWFDYVSPAFQGIFEWEPEDILNNISLVFNQFYSEDVGALKVLVNRALNSLEIFDHEWRIMTPSGQLKWLHARAVPHREENGNIVVYGMVRDISDRKQAEIILQQQARQEQLLFSITQAIRQSLDLNVILKTAVTQVRQTLEADWVLIYRFNSNFNENFIVESIDENWRDSLEDYQLTVQQKWIMLFVQKTLTYYNYHNKMTIVPDIYQAPISLYNLKILEQFKAKSYIEFCIFSGNKIWGLFLVFQNSKPRNWESWEVALLEQISDQLAIAIQQSQLCSQLQIELYERQQTEAEWREAERRWRSLLENVQLIVVGLDLEGNINYVNPFFLHLTGYTESEVLGQNWFENFLLASELPEVNKVFSGILAENAYPYHQNYILTKSGEEKYIAWNNTMLQDSGGEVIGLISIGEDITERQKIEEIKNEFIGIVSHELRTPLTAIQMSLGLLNTGIYEKKPEKFRRMIEIALLDTNRLVNLVNDILDLERLESGRAILDKTVCQAADLIQQAIDGIQAIATQQQITLSFTPTDAEVWASPDGIIQTLTNLLSNAIKFSPPNSRIDLSAESQTDCVLFKVSDRGRGIPADQLEAIFGRFQQIDASDSRQKGGTGLGLAICKSIVEQHGGKIWVESRIGEGSTFFFTVPLPSQESL